MSPDLRAGMDNMPPENPQFKVPRKKPMKPSLDKDSTPKRKMYYVSSGQLDVFAGQAPPAQRFIHAEQVKELQELGPEQMDSIFPPSPKPSTHSDDGHLITRGELFDILAYRHTSPDNVERLVDRVLKRLPLDQHTAANLAGALTDEELQAEIDRRTHALSIRLGVDLPQDDSTEWQVKPGQMMVLPEPQPMQVELTPAALQGIADAIQHAVGEGMIEGFRWKMG